MLFHHVGAASQQTVLQLCAIKRNGDARQCITHSELAIAPRVSGFFRISFMNRVS